MCCDALFIFGLENGEERVNDKEQISVIDSTEQSADDSMRCQRQNIHERENRQNSEKNHHGLNTNVVSLRIEVCKK